MKPCPFCGSEDIIINIAGKQGDINNFGFAWCKKCLLESPTVEVPEVGREDKLRQILKNNWNTRPLEDALRKELEHYKRAMYWLICPHGVEHIEDDTELLIAQALKETEEHESRP